MCFSSGSSKAPPPQQPTKFEYLPKGNDVARQAAGYEAAGYTNTAKTFGSELGTGTPAQPAAQPATHGVM